MEKKIPNSVGKSVKKAIFERADEFGYIGSGRIESGRFMDELVNDPEIGGVLKEYLEKARVRTYIKDGVLNAYTKMKKKEQLNAQSPESVIFDVYNKNASVIQECKGKDAGLFVLRDDDGGLYVLSGGTVLKWETALRKALEIIARERNLVVNNSAPNVCLRLVLCKS